MKSLSVTGFQPYPVKYNHFIHPCPENDANMCFSIAKQGKNMICCGPLRTQWDLLGKVTPKRRFPPFGWHFRKYQALSMPDTRIKVLSLSQCYGFSKSCLFPVFICLTRPTGWSLQMKAEVQSAKSIHNLHKDAWCRSEGRTNLCNLPPHTSEIGEVHCLRTSKKLHPLWPFCCWHDHCTRKQSLFRLMGWKDANLQVSELSRLCAGPVCVFVIHPQGVGPDLFEAISLRFRFRLSLIRIISLYRNRSQFRNDKDSQYDWGIKP